MDVGRDVAAVMGQQSDQDMGLGGAPAPTFGECRCGLGGYFFTAGALAGWHLGYPKTQSPPPAPGGPCCRGPAHGAEIRNLRGGVGGV